MALAGDFADVLSQFLVRDGRNPSQLSQQIGDKFGPYHKIPRETLYRWVNGYVKRPRDWRDIVRLAVVLRLTRDEASSLLLAAEHCSLDVLREQAQTETEANLQSDVAPLTYLAQLRTLRGYYLNHPSLQGWGGGYSPTGHEAHVALTLSFSTNRLNPTDETDALAQLLLARAACFAPDEPIPNHLLRTTLPHKGKNASATNPLLVADALSRLLALGLIQESSDRAFFRLHRLLAAFVNSLGSDVAAQSDVEKAVLIETQRLIKRRNPGPLRVWDTHLYHLTGMAKTRQDVRAADLCQALAEYLQLSGKYNEARPYFEQALDVRCRVLGAAHPDTASTLHCLGVMLGETRNFAEAQPCLEQALLMREQALGSEHLDVAASLSALGNVLLAAGKLSAAQPYLERALAIHKRQSGPDHTQTAR